jgi:hypothetical protein
MSAPLNTYGLTPLKLWKFWEIDGWQLLVSVREHEDDASRDSVVFAVGCDQIDGEISMSISGHPHVVAKIFGESVNDEAAARTALQAVFDYSEKVMPGLAAKAAKA